jgi:ribonuclease R
MNKKTHWSALDPDHEQERRRYGDTAGPSRLFILHTLESKPLKADNLARHWELNDGQSHALFRRLDAMVRDGQLQQDPQGRYQAAPELPSLVGKVSLHRDGYGFMLAEDGGQDLFLPPHTVRGLLNGDRVRARVTQQDGRGRREGVVLEIIEKVSRTLIGRLYDGWGQWRVKPHNGKTHPYEVEIAVQHLNGAKNGETVLIELLIEGSQSPSGKVLEVLEAKGTDLEIQIALRSHQLPYVFPEAVEAETALLNPEVQPEQWAGRKDLRDLWLLTIDGADSRDFDDAVCAEKVKGGKGGWRLWVAIADVSAYVVPGTALDAEAEKRGTSIYFPSRVIPMLPELLSNGLCSLNPHVPRLCMVCEMRVLPTGEVESSKFYEAVMQSKARCTYDEVAELLANPSAIRPDQHALLTPLQTLHGLYEAFLQQRQARGSMEFESNEGKIVFNAERQIEKIVPVTRNVAHKMIEECMIAANVQSAMFAESKGIPALYRSHERPDALKLKALREFLAVRGLSLSGGEQPQPSDFAALSKAAEGREDSKMIGMLILRSQMQARYTAECKGHFGLALSHYGHFTSPIRRYPDLLLHRAIKHALLGKKAKSYDYSLERMAGLGEHCSMTERRADEASREVMAWLKCDYMRQHVGEVFMGTVSGVTSFGLFVELEGMMVDGLLHISSLGDDYYRFDAANQQIIGERGGTAFKLMQKLEVRVARANPDERKIDLMLAGTPSTSGSGNIQGAPPKSPAAKPAAKPFSSSKRRSR